MRRRRSVMWLDNQQVQSIFQVNCLQLNVTSDCVFASGGIPLWIALRWYRLCCSLTFGPAVQDISQGMSLCFDVSPVGV